MKVNSELLYESINDGSIKAGTKFKVYKDDNYVTKIFWDGENFNWESGTFTSGAFFNPLYDFEIIEEEKEISKITKEEFERLDKRTLLEIIVKNQNQLIDEIKKLKKE